MNFRIVALILAYLRGLSTLGKDQITTAVDCIKDAWLEAFKQFKEHTDGLNDKVCVYSVGVLCAKERLKALIQKVGAMKHEVEQLIALDNMPRFIKSTLGEALRTRDATSLVRSVGWQGWLQYALAYRRVSVGSMLRALGHYDVEGSCFSCGGAGIRTQRRKRRTPKVTTNKLAGEWYTNQSGEKCWEQLYETITEHYKVFRGRCPNCKGSGRRKSANKPIPMPFDLVDIIEMTAIMKALDEHEGVGGKMAPPAHFDKNPKEKRIVCRRCGAPADKPVCKRMVPMGNMHNPLAPITNDLTSWLPMVMECGGLWTYTADVTMDDHAQYSTYERVAHNNLMDHASREFEPGGDINVNPDDHLHALDAQLEAMDGQFSLQALKRMQLEWTDYEKGMLPFMKRFNGNWNVMWRGLYTQPVMDKDSISAMTTRAGEHPFKSYDKDMPIKFGTKDPSIFSRGFRYRGTLKLDDVIPACRSVSNERIEHLPCASTQVPSWFDNYGGSGPLQELLADRIYSGAFAWDTTFYTYRDVGSHFQSHTGAKVPHKHPSKWASVYILIDDEIRSMFTSLHKDAHSINMGITGDIVAILRTNAVCPDPLYTMIFNNGGNIVMPVAHYAHGKWHVCHHVVNLDYKKMLTEWLKDMQPADSPPAEHFVEHAKHNMFSNGVRKYPKEGDKVQCSKPILGKKHKRY